MSAIYAQLGTNSRSRAPIEISGPRLSCSYPAIIQVVTRPSYSEDVYCLNHPSNLTLSRCQAGADNFSRTEWNNLFAALSDGTENLKWSHVAVGSDSGCQLCSDKVCAPLVFIPNSTHEVFSCLLLQSGCCPPAHKPNE
jgi:hypothetical protein